MTPFLATSEWQLWMRETGTTHPFCFLWTDKNLTDARVQAQNNQEMGWNWWLLR